MHTAPRLAGEIGGGMEFNSIVINAIVSGTVAALVSGIFQLVDTRNGSDYRRRQYFDSRKVDEYFVALEAYSTLVNSLYDLSAAMSGRKSPDDCEELDEKQEMIDRDRRGSEALGTAFIALRNAGLASTRLDLLGSIRARADFACVQKVYDDYAREVIEEAERDGIFRASSFNSMMVKMNDSIARLVDNAKVDLGL